MKLFIERILDAFYPIELRKKFTPKKYEYTWERQIVSTLSSGNLNLRLGRYITQEQMDEFATIVYGNFYNSSTGLKNTGV